MAEGEDLNRRKVLKTLGLTGAASASVLSGRASAENVSGNETEGYGSDGESDTVSVFSKTERVDLTDNPDLGERIWPVDTDASGEVCRPASGGAIPATGEGSATWFGFGGCGTWKIFDVQPGETYKITSRIDTCFDCVLFDDAYAVQEFVDGSWETQDSHPAIKATKTNARVVEYTPDSDRIRIKNLNGNRGIGFYLRVYGPGDSGSPERRIAEKFAPTFSFDKDEKFFPTDPTEFEDALYEVNGPNDYQGEEDFDDIFDLDPRESGYQPAEDIEDEDDPYPRTELYGPDALSEYVNSDENYTVFYNVTDALNEDETLYAVSYWQYYAFDQFVNVHWHDWEVLHVFFEGDVKNPEETEPVMAVASAHRGLAADNEYTGLDRERIGILSELGAHANATDVDSPARTGPDGDFNRAEECPPSPAPADPFCQEDPIDVTNFNDAYGLPRDEKGGNSRGEIAVDNAYYRATIEGTPVQDLEVFESSEISETDLIKVDNNEDRQRRDDGETLTPDEYELASMDKVINEIDEFTGPQFDIRVADDLSSRVPLPPSPVPGLGISDELLDVIIAVREGEGFKTVGEPWKEENFSNPTGVVCDTEYLTEDRGYAIKGDVIDEPEGKIRGGIQDTVAGTEGTIPSGKFGDGTVSDDVTQEVVENANITYASPNEEGIVVINSEPRIGPTSNARVVVNGLELGEHKLIIDSPNRGPYSQRIQVDEGRNLAGVDGRISLAPDEELSKIVGTTLDEKIIANLTVSEDYLGTVYDAKPLSDDKFEVFIHHAGVYTVEITTQDGEMGAYRVDPDVGKETTIENLSTGKRVISQYLVDYLRDTAEEARDIIDNENGNTRNSRGNGSGGIGNSIAVKFETAADVAERAVEAIESGRGNTARRANNQLNTVSNQLDAVENELDAQRGNKVGEAEYLILIDRIEQAREKVNEAAEADE